MSTERAFVFRYTGLNFVCFVEFFFVKDSVDFGFLKFMPYSRDFALPFYDIHF